jgi:asparagine synthetase B (glutamine-hydrolysing)
MANGATNSPEYYDYRGFTIVFNRYNINTKDFSTGSFPIESSRYVLAYNGEVYRYKDMAYNNSNFPSDAHFALNLIEEHGIEKFFSEADFQGTYIVIDKLKEQILVFVDHINSCGCFYSAYQNKIIINQEYAVINEVLNNDNASASTPIKIIHNGCYIRINISDLSIEENVYSQAYKKVFAHKPNTNGMSIESLAFQFNKTLKEAISDRIPPVGNFGILCSGGIDSSLILKLLYEILKQRNQLNRLTVFTLGSRNLPLNKNENDLLNIEYLLKKLSLIKQHVVIPTHGNDSDYLYKSKVFTSNARLITPNPSRTQIRHTVQMSCVLSYIAWNYPEIEIVFTGDYADELFAGYNSMHQLIINFEELRQNVINKLNDLPLNDASRVVLASLHGCAALLKEKYLNSEIKRMNYSNSKIQELISVSKQMTREELKQYYHTNYPENQSIQHVINRIKPIEIRYPYSSVYVLKFLENLKPQLLIGLIDGKLYTKFFLRLCGIIAGLPKRIALRKKIP